MKKPAYRSPADVAEELTRHHAASCDDCDDDIVCQYHQGYRDGITLLLLRASVGS